MYKTVVKICQSVSLSIEDHGKLTCHRQFNMSNFTLATIFFSLALIMGQLPNGQMFPGVGGFGPKLPDWMFDRFDPPLDKDQSDHYDYDFDVDHPMGIIVARSQPESGSEEREMYEKYGKYPKFALPDGRVPNLRSQSESGSEEHKKNEKHGKYDDREFFDFCVAINKFCKLSGSGEDFKWQGLHLCTKVCAIPGLMPKYYSNKKHGLFLGQPGTDCHFYVNFSKNV